MQEVGKIRLHQRHDSLSTCASQPIFSSSRLYSAAKGQDHVSVIQEMLELELGTFLFHNLLRLHYRLKAEVKEGFIDSSLSFFLSHHNHSIGTDACCGNEESELWALPVQLRIYISFDSVPSDIFVFSAYIQSVYFRHWTG